MYGAEIHLKKQNSRREMYEKAKKEKGIGNNDNNYIGSIDTNRSGSKPSTKQNKTNQ